MKIKTIVVKNFRSIQNAKIDPSNFNFFVGQNNHGKTNFFEAINYLYNGLAKGQAIKDLVFGHDTNVDMTVSIEFTDLDSGIEAMKNEKNKAAIAKMLAGQDCFTLSRTNGDKWQITVSGEVLDKNPTGFENALKDFLPRLEYVTTKQYFDDVGRFDRRTPISIMLSGVLEAVIEKNESYQELREKFSELFEGEDSQVSTELKNLSGVVEVYLKKQFPDCASVRFEINPPQFSEYLKGFDTQVDDGVETTVSDKGDGMQRALMLAIIQAYADYRKQGDDIGKSFIFLIDEAELHLHPTAQRKLKNALFDICSNGDQVFVNTHSSVLITEDCDNQCVFKVEKMDKITSISPIIDPQEKQNIVFELLGGSPTDLLLPSNFLIVEGESDQIFLELVIKRFYADRSVIKIINADGFAAQAGRIVDAINKLYAPIEPIYGDKLVIILDQPNTRNLREYTTFRSKYAQIDNSGRMFDLGVSSLEAYYPSALIQGRSLDDKKKLARYVGNIITQEQFQTDMPLMHDALEKCWTCSFGSIEQDVRQQTAA